MSNGDALALTAEEREALIGLLRRAIDEARYPFSHHQGDPRQARPAGAEIGTAAAAAVGDGADARARSAETVKEDAPYTDREGFNEDDRGYRGRV